MDKLNFFLFPVGAVEEESGEDERDPQPLPRQQAVAEEDDGGQNSEELPGRRHDRAGQRTEVTVKGHQNSNNGDTYLYLISRKRITLN